MVVATGVKGEVVLVLVLVLWGAGVRWGRLLYSLALHLNSCMISMVFC